METQVTEVTASALKQRMKARGLSQIDLARAAGMQQCAVSGILGGYVRMGPKREAQLAEAILALGLDRDAPPQPTPPAEPVVIRIRRSDGEE